MSLTTEQLEHAIWCAREACDKNYGGADVYFAIAEKTVDALEAELHRRKHGPFTLAEAVASGRPFRRKAWGDDPSFCRLDKDCSSSWFDFGWQTDCIDPDDITATDYELKDGGGDAS